MEHTEPEKRVSEIENEESMIIEIGKAFASGDLMKFAEATQKYSGYLSRNLTEARKAIDDLNVECSSLQEMNAMLAEKSLVWEPRRTLNALVRAIAAAVFDHRYSQAWDRFYRELKYRTGINLTSRSAAKGGRVLDAVRDEEWPQLMKVIASLCYDYCIDVVHTTNEETVAEYNLDTIETEYGIRHNRGTTTRKVSDEELQQIICPAV